MSARRVQRRTVLRLQIALGDSVVGSTPIWLGVARDARALRPPLHHAGIGPQGVSFDPRPPPRVFKGLHGSNVKAIIKP